MPQGLGPRDLREPLALAWTKLERAPLFVALAWRRHLDVDDADAAERRRLTDFVFRGLVRYPYVPELHRPQRRDG